MSIMGGIAPGYSTSRYPSLSQHTLPHGYPTPPSWIPFTPQYPTPGTTKAGGTHRIGMFSCLTCFVNQKEVFPHILTCIFLKLWGGETIQHTHINVLSCILGRLACTLKDVLLLQPRPCVRGSMEHVFYVCEEKSR